jgi:hypothetical protein
MKRDTWEDSAKDTFVRGTPITTLFPECHAFYSFLLLESWEIENTPGALTKVLCQFTGFNDSEYESDREVTYILTGTRREASIFHHPLYVKEVKDFHAPSHRIMLQIAQGIWARDDLVETDLETKVEVYHIPSAGYRDNFHFTDTGTVKWFKFIFDDGNLTYKAPTLQWTRETANLGGLTGDEVLFLGLVDEPPGDPPMPFEGDFEWLKISLDETKTRGVSSYSETWELSPPGGFPRFPNTDGTSPGITGAGIYNYDPRTL